MPVGAFRWGASSSGASPHYENELLIGYSLFDWITDRPPREGSVFVQAPSGAEDAWVTGRDYVMDAEVRFIPDKPSTSPERAVVAGPLSVQAFLDYCRDKNDFRFVPNVNTPDFYVEQCYLVEPIRGFGGNLADLTRGVRLVMRSTSMDFTQAMRGIALEYKPGEHLNQISTGAVFTRATVATYARAASTVSQGHLVGSVGAGVVRDRYRSSSSAPGTLLERGSTNIAFNSEVLGAWALGGASVTTNDRRAPNATGSTTADKLVASTSSGNHFAASTYADITAGETLSALVHVRGAELGQVELMVQDPTGTHDFRAVINTTAASATGAASGSASVSIGPVIRALDDVWYEARVAGVLASTSTGARAVLRLLSTAGASVFAGSTTPQGLHAWGVSLVREDSPGSYVPSSTAAGTRATDQLKFGYPWKPQVPAWWYVRFQDLGTMHIADGFLAGINSTNDAAPRIRLARMSTSGNYEFIYSASTETLRVNIASTHAYGDWLELFALLSTDRSLTLRQSINGAAETASTGAAATAPLPSTWDAAEFWLGGLGTVLLGQAAFGHVKHGFSTGVTTLAGARSA